MATNVTSKPSFASIKNSKFANSQAHYVSIKDRLQLTLAELPTAQQANLRNRLTIALRKFAHDYPNIKSFNRAVMQICEAVDHPISKILIDTTRQRELNILWVIQIIETFRPHQVQAIQVYRSFANNAEFISWDGQHTIVALYLIAEFLRLDLTTTFVPTCVYSVTSLLQIRDLFISGNTTKGVNAGKCALDKYDLFVQKVYGVRVDHSNNTEWLTTSTKQGFLEKAGLFVTSSRLGDHNEIGAISRLDEIDDSSIEVVRQFCVYGNYIVAAKQRAIDSKELPIIFKLLAMAESDQIKYTDSDITDLAMHCDSLFGADFSSSSVFWDQAHQANINAFVVAHQHTPMNLRPTAPRNLKNIPQGVSFLWQQLNHSWAKPAAGFPRMPNIQYVANTADLF